MDQKSDQNNTINTGGMAYQTPPESSAAQYVKPPQSAAQVPAASQYQTTVPESDYMSLPDDNGLGLYYEQEEDKANTFGTLGLIASISGFLTGIFGLGLILDLVGIALGTLSINKDKTRKGRGIGAISIGSAGFLLTLLVYGFAFWGMNQEGYFEEDHSVPEVITDTYSNYEEELLTDDETVADSDATSRANTGSMGVRAKTRYKVGDTIPVHSRYGDYNITILGVSETEERNDYADTDPKRVVLIDYSYENVSYAISWDDYYNDELYISSSDFDLYDADGNAMSDYPIYHDYIRAVSPGHKTTGQMAFGLDSKKDYIELEYSDYASDDPGFVIDLEW